MALRILGIVAATVCLVAVGTIGTRFIPVPDTVPAPGRTSFTLAAGTSDADGAIPVPASSKRMYAVKQSDDRKAMITMYATPRLSPEQVAEFYLQEMPIYGWTEAETREEELNKHVEEIMLFFRRTGRECLICVGSEGVGAAWTIMTRPVIIGGRR